MWLALSPELSSPDMLPAMWYTSLEEEQRGQGNNLIQLHKPLATTPLRIKPRDNF